MLFEQNSPKLQWIKNQKFYEPFLSKGLQKQGEKDEDGKTLAEDEMQEIDEPLHDPSDKVYQKHERTKRALGLSDPDHRFKLK